MLLIVIVLSGQLVPKLQITISWYKLEMKVSGLSKLSKLFKTKNKLSFGRSIGEIFVGFVLRKESILWKKRWLYIIFFSYTLHL